MSVSAIDPSTQESALPAPVRLPRDLAEVRSFLASLGEVRINMYSKGGCLGAMLIQALNPQAEAVEFFYSSFTLWMPYDRMRSSFEPDGVRQVYLIGPVAGFFRWLFEPSGPVGRRHAMVWDEVEANCWTPAELMSELDRYVALHAIFSA